MPTSITIRVTFGEWDVNIQLQSIPLFYLWINLMHFGWSRMSRVKDLPQITLQWGTSQCTEAPSPQKEIGRQTPWFSFFFEGRGRLYTGWWGTLEEDFSALDCLLIPVFSIPNTTGVRASNSPQTELIKFFRWVLRRRARMAEAL